MGFLLRKHGAGKEARTLDLYLGKVSLYQLSYSRIVTTCVVFKKSIGADFLNLVAWGGIEPPTQGFSIQATTVVCTKLSLRIVTGFSLLSTCSALLTEPVAEPLRVGWCHGHTDFPM